MPSSPYSDITILALAHERSAVSQAVGLGRIEPQQLRQAERIAKKATMSTRGHQLGPRNVCKDLRVPNAEQHLVKAQLVFKIDGIRKERGLKQIEMASLLGIRQPDISKMLRGEFRQFSVEPLLRFLVTLNQDVEIVVKPHLDRRNAPALQVS